MIFLTCRYYSYATLWHNTYYLGISSKKLEKEMSAIWVSLTIFCLRKFYLVDGIFVKMKQTIAQINLANLSKISNHIPPLASRSVFFYNNFTIFFTNPKRIIPVYIMSSAWRHCTALVMGPKCRQFHQYIILHNKDNEIMINIITSCVKVAGRCFYIEFLYETILPQI